MDSSWFFFPAHTPDLNLFSQTFGSSCQRSSICFLGGFWSPLFVGLVFEHCHPPFSSSVSHLSFWCDWHRWGFSILCNTAKGFELAAEQNTLTFKSADLTVSPTVKGVCKKRVMMIFLVAFFASCYLLCLWMQYSRVGFLCRQALQAFITYPTGPVSVVSFSCPVLLAFAHLLTPAVS